MNPVHFERMNTNPNSPPPTNPHRHHRPPSHHNRRRSNQRNHHRPNHKIRRNPNPHLPRHPHPRLRQPRRNGSHPQAFTAINRFLATKGVGRYLATTVTAPIDQTLKSLEGIANAIEASPQPKQATPIGIHLEGPFISHAKRGVHPPADIHPPSIALFNRFNAAARGHIRLITIAPEIPGALDLIRHCAALNIRVSLGHSNAKSPETEAAIAAGATSATHTFNAMRPLDHRDPGIVGTVLDNHALYAELICDGIHVAPELVRLWLR